MKKIIIGTLVGAILLFTWQSLSWTVFNFHEKAYKYTPAQDTLIRVISNTLKEDGQYSLPSLPPGSDRKAMEDMEKNLQGKPWIAVSYISSFKSDMLMQIIRAFLVCLFCTWLCCVLIGRLGNKSFGAVFTTTLSFGIICFLYVWYIGHIWMHTNWDVLKPELLDNLAGWGLAGIWLGWWYSRRS